MGLMSFFQRQKDESAAEAQAPDAVTHARTRARRRLIGATVLLGIGVIGFPLLFETQPRPVPVDIPIEIPKREAAPPLPLPPVQPAQPAPAATVPPPAVAEAPPGPVAPGVITERAAEQGREVAPAKPAASAPARPAPLASAPASPRPVASAPRPAPSAPAGGALPARPAAPIADDGQRARALLEGKPASPAPAAAAKPADAAASAARVVVQVGAYTDADKLREARQKVEKLGFKTYTQVIEADGAKRTRVRIGPFATREEADKAAARLKAVGLPAAILSL
jgi:DedD protein